MNGTKSDHPARVAARTPDETTLRMAGGVACPYADLTCDQNVRAWSRAPVVVGF